MTQEVKVSARNALHIIETQPLGLLIHGISAVYGT